LQYLFLNNKIFDEAIKTGLEALEYHKKSGSTNDEIWVYITMANIFCNQNNFPKSHEYYDKALELSSRFRNQKQDCQNLSGERERLCVREKVSGC
jgi:tetratricopeptide (TPR) repeat protein